MTTTIKNLILTVLCLSLCSCFYFEKSIYSICDDTPHICDDIKTKGWCNDERSLLIRNRHNQILYPDNQENLYNSLVSWQSFSQCIEIASNIKRRDINDRDSIKAATFVHSIHEIEKLEKLTKNSNFPHLMYYHWTQDGDIEKIEKLKTLDDNGQLNTSELQFKMAFFYGKTDKEKSVQAQYKALSLLTEKDLNQLDHNVFANISTYYYQMRNLKHAYIWAQVAIKFGLKANIYSSLTRELKRKNTDFKALDLTAIEIYTSINELNFSVTN